MTTETATGHHGAPPRRIGPAGTGARAALGLALLAAAGAGAGWADAAAGLLGANAVVLAVLALRGRAAPALRLTGLGRHLANAGLIAAFLALWPAAALLFFGSALLVAAARGDAACEALAVSNLLRDRDDRIGCPVLLPLDWAEERLGGRAGAG